MDILLEEAGGNYFRVFVYRVAVFFLTFNTFLRECEFIEVARELAGF